MTSRPLVIGITLCVCALSRGAAADKATGTASPSITADFVLSDAPCARGTIAIDVKVQNKTSATFNGKVFSNPTDFPEGQAFHVDAGATESRSAKTRFGCERSPLLSTFTASVKSDTGAMIGNKTFRLQKHAYPQLSARPPSSGSGVKNVLFVTGVVVEQATCGQPLVVTVAGKSLMADTPIQPLFSVDTEVGGAADRNQHLAVHQSIAQGASFSVRLQGAALDCTTAAPVIKPKVSISGTTIPVQGAVEGSPAMHAESEVWQ